MPAKRKYENNGLVYPGVYTLLPEAEKLIRRKNPNKNIPAFNPSAKLYEFDDHYGLDVYMPGAIREELHIEIIGKKLLIMAIPQANKQPVPDRNNQELIQKRMELQVQLPTDADTGFMCANFKDGILKFHIPKTIYPANNTCTRLVAY